MLHDALASSWLAQPLVLARSRPLDRIASSEFVAQGDALTPAVSALRLAARLMPVWLRLAEKDEAARLYQIECDKRKLKGDACTRAV